MATMAYRLKTFHYIDVLYSSYSNCNRQSQSAMQTNWTRALNLPLSEHCCPTQADLSVEQTQCLRISPIASHAYTNLPLQHITQKYSITFLFLLSRLLKTMPGKQHKINHVSYSQYWQFSVTKRREIYIKQEKEVH